jgi:hypothetical protein
MIDSFFLRHFKITADDFKDALKALMPRAITYLCCDPNKPEEANPVWKECDDILDGWFAHIMPDEGLPYEYSDYGKFKRFIEIINDIYDVHEWDLLQALYTNNDPEKAKYPDDATKIKPYVFKMFKDARKKYHVLTMSEVAHAEDAKFFCHMDDNEIWGMKDSWLMQKKTAQKAGAIKYYSQRDIDRAIKQDYQTDGYTFERVLELIVRYWVSKKRVNLDDPEFINYWKVPDDHWWKRNEKYKNREYFFDGKKPEFKDILETFCYAANMHEG